MFMDSMLVTRHTEFVVQARWQNKILCYGHFT